jgi:hypothetical protein
MTVLDGDRNGQLRPNRTDGLWDRIRSATVYRSEAASRTTHCPLASCPVSEKLRVLRYLAVVSFDTQQTMMDDDQGDIACRDLNKAQRHLL